MATNGEKRPQDHPMEEELEVRFTYHPPREGQKEKYEDLREDAHFLAELIVRMVPDCRERDIALEHLEAAVMFANAGIARREGRNGE